MPTLNYFTFYQYLDQKFKDIQPQMDRSGTGAPSTPANTIMRARGFVGDEVFAVPWKDPNVEVHYLTTLEKVNGWHLQWRMPGDVELLKKVFATYIREVEWKKILANIWQPKKKPASRRLLPFTQPIDLVRLFWWALSDSNTRPTD